MHTEVLTGKSLRSLGFALKHTHTHKEWRPMKQDCEMLIIVKSGW